MSGPCSQGTTRLPGSGSGAVLFLSHRERAISPVGERFVHTEEVTGSIPVSPTNQRVQGPGHCRAPFCIQLSSIPVIRVTLAARRGGGQSGRARGSLAA